MMSHQKKGIHPRPCGIINLSNIISYGRGTLPYLIEIRIGDCVEYVGRTIMEADAKRRDELMLRIAKIPFAPLRLVLLRNLPSHPCNFSHDAASLRSLAPSLAEADKRSHKAERSTPQGLTNDDEVGVQSTDGVSDSRIRVQLPSA